MPGTIKAVVISPAAPPALVELGNDLVSLQAAVGGYLEALELGAGAVGLVDEEGKRPDPPPMNPLATMIARDARRIRTDDVIVGTMVIVGTLDPRGHRDGEFYDAPAGWVRRLILPE
jgi:Domain of unknown function (DUF3846)